jgi:hypothetical protein
MSEQRVSTGYVPRPWQLEVHNDLKRFSVLVVHRRGGKTVLAVNLLIDAALRCKKPMGRFGYIAPLLKQARQIAWDYVQHFTAEIPGMHYNQQAMVATFPNGARVSLFGADNPDSLRGLYFDGVVMDEVADMRPQVWGEVIRPALWGSICLARDTSLRSTIPTGTRRCTPATTPTTRCRRRRSSEPRSR